MYVTIASVLDEKGNETVQTVDADITVARVASMMATQGIGAVPVMVDGRLAGIFTERDALMRVLGRDLDPTATPMGAVMTKDPVTASPATSVEAALTLMSQHRCRHLPVVGADGALVGLVSVGDLTVAHLRAYQQVDVMAAGVRRLLPHGRFTGIVDLTRLVVSSLRRVRRT
ncbi:MAG: CBS domain-containing protein [Candidatus Competibacteraceae bacterium]